MIGKWNEPVDNLASMYEVYESPRCIEYNFMKQDMIVYKRERGNEK